MTDEGEYSHDSALGMIWVARRRDTEGGVEPDVLATLNISGAPSSFAKGLLAAADDITRDALLAASTSWLEKEDIRRLPALRLDEKLVCGQAGIIQLLER